MNQSAPGDYVYVIEEEIDNQWVPVLDPILEIEGGGRIAPFPKTAVAVGVGLLSGILTYKALK